jgi:hypothetical protein
LWQGGLLWQGTTKTEFGLLWQGSDYDLKLLTPDGMLIDSSNYNQPPFDQYEIEFITGGTFESFNINKPSPGQWKGYIVEDVPPPSGQPEPVRVFMSSETGRVLLVDSDKERYLVGEPMVLEARVYDGGEGQLKNIHEKTGSTIEDALVVAAIIRPDRPDPADNFAYQLYYDPTDSVYKFTYDSTDAIGSYNIFVYATDFYANDSSGILVMNREYLLQSDHSIFVSQSELPESRSGKALILQARDLLITVKNMLSGGDRSKVNSAINKINSALANKNFLDDNNLSNYGLSFYDDITGAVNNIDFLKSSPAVGDQILKAFELLYNGSLIFAEMAIENADDNCVVTNCEEILSNANTELGKALKGYNKELFVNTMNHLTNAWKFAQQAMGTNLKKEAGELSGIPTEYGMDQNYPNPFNPATQINYQLPEKNHVTLEIYDVLGNLVSTILDEEMDAGYHSIVWNASGLSSGVYFYTIRSGSFITTKKLVLLK